MQNQIKEMDQDDEIKAGGAGDREEDEEEDKARVAIIEEKEKETEEEKGENKEKDLFGSSPFSPSSFVINSFDFNSLRNVTEQTPKQSAKMTFANQEESYDDYTQVSVHPIQAQQSSPNVCHLKQAITTAAAAASSTTKTVLNSKFTDVSANSDYSRTFLDASKDLFGSIPFDEFASLQLNEEKKRSETRIPFVQLSSSSSSSTQLRQSQPQEPGFVGENLDAMLLDKAQPPISDRATSTLQEVYTIKSVHHTARITVQTMNSVSKPDVASDIVSPMSPEPLVVTDDDHHDMPRHKREKSNKSEKSKYHLISEIHSDISDVLSSSKLTHKSKSTCYGKKTPRAKKCSVVSTAAGFSNMSFEDFPSDENEERQIRNTKIAPFEVIREPEKRFGSLKRRSNPFT